MRRVRQRVAGWSPAQRDKVVRWTSAGIIAVLAVVCVVVAGWRLPKDDSAQAALPVPAADLAVIDTAAGTCPALTTPRLAGQLMATSAFRPRAASTAIPGGTGIAGLSDAAWRQWRPARRPVGAAMRTPSKPWRTGCAT